MASSTLRLGIENQVPGSTLASSPSPEATTPIDWLKQEWRARKVVYANPGGEITITGTLDSPQVLEYFVLAGIEHQGIVEIQFIAYLDDNGTPVGQYTSPFVAVSDIPPLGEWRVGIDPYGASVESTAPLNYVVWLDEAVQYDSFEITIRAEGGGDPGPINITTAMMGHKLEFDYSFANEGNNITFLTEPSLVRVASGKYIPSRPQRYSRTFTLNLQQMTDADRVRLRRVEIGEAGNVILVSGYPDKSGWQYNDYNFLCRFANSLGYAHDALNIHSTTMTLVEA